MVECNSIEKSNIYPNLNATPLTDQQHFKLNKINEIKDYFVAENKERELMSKRISKFIASFEYFDKSLIVLSATSGSISIASFATVIGTPVGITSESLCLLFSLPTGIVKKLLKTTRNKKKKHNKIIMLAKSKLNSIEIKVSETLMNNEINYQDIMIIINSSRFNKSITQNQQLAEELHKPIIGKFKKRKVHAAFKDYIWDADLADMQLISKYNKGVKFFLCVIDIFSKYTWVVPLKDKQGVSIVGAFQKI